MPTTAAASRYVAAAWHLGRRFGLCALPAIWLAVAEEWSAPSARRAADVPELLRLVEAADLFTPDWAGADT